MINTSELEKEYKELLIKNNSGNSMELLQKAYRFIPEEYAPMGGTTTADIANTENSLNEILLSYYMERGIPSIARDALNITNMVGNTNFFFTIQPKSDDSGIEIVKRGITAQETPVKSVSVTLEALHDMFSVHGLDGIKLIANFLRDKANAEENQTFINFLSSNALEKNPLTFTEPQNAELIHFELSKRIQQYVFEMNMKHQRTFEAFGLGFINIAVGLPRWLSNKEFTCQCRRHRRCRLDPWVGKIPWRRKWQPTKSGKPQGVRMSTHNTAVQGLI